MMKRMMSLLLCLLMVLSIAAPTVQASNAGSISTSGNILDGIYIPDGANANVVVNGVDVTEQVGNKSDKLPTPGELVTETTTPATPMVEVTCQCADLSSLEDHTGVCKVKAHYYELCDGTEEKLYAQWSAYTAVEQSFMRDYLREKFPLKLVSFEKMLSAPSGFAYETLADGTTVSVEGIPLYGSLTVSEAKEEIKNIVDTYVSENEVVSTELFSYDVSVRDAEGSDWQPNTTVKMELELPGEKLHKYTKVYVVHVDDNGVATTIDAEVTEDGKIAFETPGFSTFAGFTVDFDYDGVQFCIPGMTSIKLSELFDNLQMPLYAEDVVNVEYTDPTQIRIEQLEGDWLLTSLKAFTTEEKLSLTMTDGTVYQIKVTDDLTGARADCYFAYVGYTSNICYIDVNYGSGNSHNGVLTLKVSDNTGYGITTNDNKSDYYYDSNWWNYRVVFDGNGISGQTTGVTNGAFEVCIQKDGDGDDFKIPVLNWYITDGAIVNVYLEGFDSNDTISFESWTTGSPLITVDDGTLYFNVDGSVLPKDANTETGYAHNFHVTQCAYNEIIFDGYNNVENNEDAILFLDDGADNLYFNDVKFINSGRRAVFIQADLMGEFRMDNCIFESSIYSTNGGGGVMYIAEKTSGGAWVNVNKLTMRYCEFNENTVGSTEKDDNGKLKVVRGGAILVWGNLDATTFYHCKFYKTHSTAQGGAVAIGNQANSSNFNQGSITFEECQFDGTYNDASLAGAVLICQLSDNLTFKNCTFDNIAGAGHGGAIHIGGTDDVAIEFASFTMTGCTFYNCSTTGGRGSALRLYSATATPITITDCTFDTCSSSSLGGALSFQGTIGNILISGTGANKSSFSNCQSTGERGGAISLDATVTKFEVKNTSFTTCKSLTNRGGAIYHGGTTGDFDVTNCTFTGCESKIYGGAICLLGRTTTADITGGSFINCKAGGTQPIYQTDKDGNATTTPVYDKKGNPMYNGTGGGAAICIAQNHGKINIGGTSTTKQSFKNCESLNNGGAISFEGDCEVQNCNIQYVSIDGCKARDSGTAILMGDVTIVKMYIADSEIKNCTYISGRTGDAAIENSMYDEYYTEGMPYDQIIFRSNDSCGTIRTIGSCKAQLTVESVTFSNNTSFTGGGGIYWNANRLAGYTTDKDGTYNFTNSLIIKSCTFNGNKALRDGGAIYVEASLTIDGGTFKNNSAERGGAIAQQIYNNSGRPIQSGESNNLTITNNAVFEENYARKHGGAISIRANATSSIPTSANLSYPITFTLNGATIKNNRAAENGGGVYFNQSIYPADYTASELNGLTEEQIAEKAANDNREVENYVKSCILSGATIYGNYAGCGAANLTTPGSASGSGHGGGIYLAAEKNTTLQILGSNIYSNTAYDGNGGGVYMTGTDGLCDVKKNADGVAPVIGGAADKANKAISANGDQSKGNGGGIAIFHGAKIVLEYGTISYNTADTAGGGIAANASKMSANNGTVSHNRAAYGAGISLVKCGDTSTIVDASTGTTSDVTPVWGMEFSNGTISDNVASAIGGGICLSNASTMKLNGGDVQRNYVATTSVSNNTTTYSYAEGQNGGGIAVCQGSCMNIYSGTVDSNHAYNGGGINVQGLSRLQMLLAEGSEEVGIVSNNNAHGVRGDGGGIGILEGCTAYLQQGKIHNNTSNYWGGGIHVSGATLMVSGAEIYENHGVYSGGGMYVKTGANGEQATVSITGGKIYKNDTTNGWGGAIYMYGDDVTTTISGGEIYQNKVTLYRGCGGALNAENGAEVIVKGGDIYENYSNGYGGAIHSYNDSTVTVRGGSIRNNRATIGGGGIALRNNSTALITTMESGTDIGKIVSNTASKGGGVYVTTGAEVTVIDGQITHNTATGMPDSSLNITTGRNQEVNLAGVGGGIFVADGNSASDRSVFKLEGNEIAIYGNMADFAADDVFANSNSTQLTIPTVAKMNLTGYGFAPEGWVEDYVTDDSAYSEYGLGMLTVNDSPEQTVMRYRGANAYHRRYTIVKPVYVLGTIEDPTDLGSKAVIETVPEGAPYVNKADTYVALTLGIPTAIDDTVVMDYGSEVLLSVWQNDLFLYADTTDGGINDFLYSDVDVDAGTYIGNSFIVGDAADQVHKFENAFYLKITEDEAAPFASARTGLSGSYGIVHSGGDGTFSYSYKTMEMKSEDHFFYATAHNGYWYYAKMTVIPATTLYFEDNASYGADLFVQYHETSATENLAKWEKVTAGTGADNRQQEDRPGNTLIPGVDADNIYGYDGTYATSTMYSNGSAHKVTVSRAHTDDNGKAWPTANARASFTFTGTGFDIISYCSNTTGILMVSVYKGKITNFDDPNLYDHIVASWMVDGYYKAGTVGNELYQVPLIKVDLTQLEMLNASGVGTGAFYGYDTYTVELYIAPSFFEKEVGYWTSDFILDAIRIYNPAGINGSESQVVQDAYKSDGEQWPTYQELRYLFLTENDLTSKEPTSGIFFIDQIKDANGKYTSPSVKEYQSWGPNNEVYLDPGQAISFTMNAANYGGYVDRVHLGLRGITGMGNVSIKTKKVDSEANPSTILDQPLSTTDMYYDITKAMDQTGEIEKVLVVENNGDTPIAISNLKVTHTQQPAATLKLSNFILNNGNTYQTALEILTAEELADPVVTPKYPALSFNSMICYNVFFSVDDLGVLTAADLGLAVFDAYDAEGTVETAKDVILGATEIDGLYMVATNGIHAKHLGDKQYFRAFAKKADGSYVYSKMVSYSAVDYAMNALAKSDDVKLKQLVVAMLNYGAEAQKFFGYKTDDLMNKDLTADHQALLAGFDASSLSAVGKVDAAKVGVFASNGGFSKKSPAISFKGAFEINYFLTPAYAVDGEMTLYIWNEDTYNSVAELMAANADMAVTMTLENGVYTAASDEIAAKYLDKTVYVAAVYKSNGQIYYSGVLPYSIAAYCQKSPANVQALAEAAAIYGCAAKQFFKV